MVTSAAEAEISALFHNAKTAIPIRRMLIALGHPQPPTPINTDNATAQGIVNDTMKQKRSKAMDMRYHWIRDRENQLHFKIYWTKGTDNIDPNYGDYFTKRHSTIHHVGVKHRYQ